MNKILTLILLFTVSISYSQSLPFDFETAITTSSFTDFSGGVATVMPNPQSSGINTSATVAQIVRNGGEVFAGSKIIMPNNFDFSTNNVMSMKVYTTAPVGTIVKMKFESSAGAAERDAPTTVSGAWETLTFDFTMEATGTAALNFGLQNGWTYNKASIFFNFGTDGATAREKIYYFDNIGFGETPVNTVNKMEAQGLAVFPNPTSAEWLITSEETNIIAVEIFDLQGKRLFVLHPNTQNVVVDAAHFPKGIYISKVSTKAGTKTMKLVKN